MFLLIGTTLLLFGDSSVADAINQAIGAQAFDPAQQVYPIDCAIASTGPPVVLSYNGSPFSVPASIYVFSNGDGKIHSNSHQELASLESVSSLNLESLLFLVISSSVNITLYMTNLLCKSGLQPLSIQLPKLPKQNESNIICKICKYNLHTFLKSLPCSDHPNPICQHVDVNYTHHSSILINHSDSTNAHTHNRLNINITIQIV